MVWRCSGNFYPVAEVMVVGPGKFVYAYQSRTKILFFQNMYDMLADGIHAHPCDDLPFGNGKIVPVVVYHGKPVIEGSALVESEDVQAHSPCTGCIGISFVI